MTDSLQWMVLYTKPRSEKRACELLEKQGFKIYLPCITTIKQWSDRKKKVTEPLFKSYLFIYCKRNQIEKAGRGEHIVGIVRFNGQAAIVREEEIDAIRCIEAGTSKVAVVNKKLIIGQKIRIKQGKLQGLSGILTEYRGTQRVAIEIESLGCNLLIDIPASSVEEILK